MAKPKGYRPLTTEEKAQIVARYADGETLTALCDEFKRAKSTIRPILREAGLTLRPRGYPQGTVWHDEWREAHKRGTSTPEFRQKSRETTLKRLASARTGQFVNTPIERRLHDALMSIGIGFETQVTLLDRYSVDISIYQAPIVIEADGAQHALPQQAAKDRARDAALQAAGYRVFRFTGSEINRDAGICIRRVVDECGLIPEGEPVYNIRTSFAGEQHPLWKGGKREFTCETCGAVFLAQPAHRKGPRYFCGTKCAGAARKGRPFTPEHRAKIAAGIRAYHQTKGESEPM